MLYKALYLGYGYHEFKDRQAIRAALSRVIDYELINGYLATAIYLVEFKSPFVVTTHRVKRFEKRDGTQTGLRQKVLPLRLIPKLGRISFS